MNSFFRTFFAALLALFVFSLIGLVIFFVAAAAISSAALSSSKEGGIGDKAVLVIDLSHQFTEINASDPFARLPGKEEEEAPTLYELTRMIRYAANDASVKGIYIKCESSNNDFASSEEIRNALIDFREKGKFIYAYANVISQKAYYVASMASQVYCNPIGGVEWTGFSMQVPFIKGTLDKLGIEPQIFYAGKYKDATEPLRETRMTPSSRIQSGELLSDIYGHFLLKIAEARKIDTATLHRFADSNAIAYASDALRYGMVDGLKYDDQVKDDIRKVLKLEKDGKINFVSFGKYAGTVNYKSSGTDKIAVIYAEGNIHDGEGDRGSIGGDTYRNHIRKARTDKSVKAIVLRINSGGGSSMASEVMWREVWLAKKEKPVIVSFGDVAASGGYYMACAADSIFAQPNTITGSIGVFGILPNMEKFFNEKLGITFDGIKTSPDAGAYTITKPLTAAQKRYFQNDIDSIYYIFKTRVAEGRGRSMEYVDSIAQGRVWSGKRAVALGLADRIGSLDDAIAAAASKAKIDKYGLKEYPVKQSFFEMIFGKKSENVRDAAIKNELGEEGYRTFTTIRDVKDLFGTPQARMPYEISIQ